MAEKMPWAFLWNRKCDGQCKMLCSQIWLVFIIFSKDCRANREVQTQQTGFFGSTNIGCQHKSTFGRDYRGIANTTISGIPCQKWSNPEPHDHKFTHLGDHNFCRNPYGGSNSNSQVWCFTADPEHQQENCPVPFCSSLNALDFSMDNDRKADDNNSYTHASIEKKNLPISFTICTSFMVERWAFYPNAHLFLLLDDEDQNWLWVRMYAAEDQTEFTIYLSGIQFEVTTATLYFPLDWIRVCVSLDSMMSVLRFVVEGEELSEKSMRIDSTPKNLNLQMGWNGDGKEHPGMTTDLNIFSSPLPLELMRKQTSDESEECGLPGDFFSWDESLKEEQWVLHSQARIIPLDSGLEGPCRRESKMHVYPISDNHWHSDCMEHCKKLGGHSPSVKTHEGWKRVYQETSSITFGTSKLPPLWLSATEGDVGLRLGRLGHWPERTVAQEGVWRDYYTGEQLENYTKPWLSSDQGDNILGETSNCIYIHRSSLSWIEWECFTDDMGCPCSYEMGLPIIQLRGFCSDTILEHERYTVKQQLIDPDNIMMVGYQSARIELDEATNQWTLRDPRLNVTASTRAKQATYALGKHNWTISGDVYQCSGGKPYSLELKLTGCRDDEFTCNDGQCIKMEERCNQMPNCKDTSDERGCKILVLKDGYNQRVPPIGITGREVKTLLPVPVKISLTLYKVVTIDEEGHSIELQFQIRLKWKENRAEYQNLKNESYLNALSMEEINTLWLPLVIYTNTDQQETTRLGCCVEWSTHVVVRREGDFRRSGYEVLDETELFKGEDNSLVMVQSYTHEFQCVYQLERYPFDTQVSKQIK